MPCMGCCIMNPFFSMALAILAKIDLPDIGMDDFCMICLKVILAGWCKT